MHRKAGEPQNAPFELRINIAGEKPHHPRIGAACENDARGFSAEHPMPEDASLAAWQFHIAERGARKPRPIEEPFQKRGHADPPDRMNDDEMVALLHKLLKADEIRLEWLYRPVPVVQYGIEFHFADIDRKSTRLNSSHMSTSYA